MGRIRIDHMLGKQVVFLFKLMPNKATTRALIHSNLYKLYKNGFPELTPLGRIALAAQMKLVNIIILLHECLSFFSPRCGEGDGVLTVSMCLCVGVKRNKQLFLYSYLPLCPSTSLTRMRMLQSTPL